MRDVADKVGITERAAQRIVADLIESGYVDRTRVGRRNHYSINPTVEMRHQLQRGLEIGDLLDVLRRYPSPAEPQRSGNNDRSSPSSLADQSNSR